MDKKLNASISIGLSPAVKKELIDGHSFTMQQRLFQKLFYVNWERQCAKGELLQVRQCSASDTEKRNLIEVTICVHTISGCN